MCLNMNLNDYGEEFVHMLKMNLEDSSCCELEACVDVTDNVDLKYVDAPVETPEEEMCSYIMNVDSDDVCIGELCQTICKTTYENFDDVVEPVDEDVEIQQPVDATNDSTDELYTYVVNMCRDIFLNKIVKYGANWRVLRPESITDQIYIRINRILSMEKQSEKYGVDEFLNEFRSIVNYGIIALIQNELGQSQVKFDLPSERGMLLFDKYAQKAYELMVEKNREYNESWRFMRLCSYVDFILMKSLRIKESENINKSNNIEYIVNNYYDIINYAVFAIIRMSGLPAI